MFNVQLTQKWVMGILTDPNGTANEYRDPLADWQSSFMQVALPVTLVAYIIAGILSFFSDSLTALNSPALWLMSLVWGLAWTFVIAFIFDFLSGTFGGERDFNAAYAVVALAIVPSMVGTALGPLPWIGGLLSLAASIYSLVLAYRFLPVFLNIPETARVKHFIVSILVAIVVNIVVGMTIGAQVASSVIEDQIQSSSTEVSGGLFGGIERQAQIAEVAAEDTYQPPSDGRLTEDQVASYVRVMERTAEMRSELDTDLSEKFDDKDEKPSFSDVFGGIGGVMRMTTAEMEVVKTAGGNWAEHQWVRDQLRTARIQRDLNDDVAHNYELYLEVEDRLAAVE